MTGHHHNVGIHKLRAVTHHEDVMPNHSKGGRAGDHTDELAFSLRQPTFNVLYVQTPRVGFLQAPFFRDLAQTWEETVELVKPVFRLGIPEATLFDKCPYYDPEFGKGSAGHMLATRRTRELLGFMQDGSLYGECHKPIPKGRIYIQDFPNPLTVLLLNLGAYYLITRQSNKLRGG